MSKGNKYLMPIIGVVIAATLLHRTERRLSLPKTDGGKQH